MKKSKGHYKAFCTLSGALEDIVWWKEEVTRYHRKIDLATPKHTVILMLASNEDWGGHLESLSTFGRWDLKNIDLHINAKELLAVQKCLEALCADDIHSSTILIKSDNSTTVSYLNKKVGCRSPNLNDITKDIFLWPIPRNIRLAAAHIPGKLS